ncbi:hypothetical protein E3J85_02010, partial [Patescibacteria group bacterium]
MRNKNISTRRSNKKVLKIVLWTVFALVILAGAAYASWYFLINPETRAGGGKQVAKFKVTVTENRYWAEEKTQPAPYKISGGYKYPAKVARRAWDDIKRGKAERVSLQSVIDAGEAKAIPGDGKIYGRLPKDFYLAKVSKQQVYEFEIPKGNQWYHLGKVNGDFEIKIPRPTSASGYSWGTGLTFYLTSVDNGNVELKFTRNPLDYREVLIPYYQNFKNNGKKNQETFYSYNNSLQAKFKGSNAYNTKASVNGGSAEILSAQRTVRVKDNDKESYDSEYAYGSDSNYYGYWNRNSAGKKAPENRRNRVAAKHEKIEFSFKAKNVSGNPKIDNGEGLYLINESALGSDRSPDEYAWTTRYSPKDVLHFSGDSLAQVALQPLGWGMKNKHFISLPSYLERSVPYGWFGKLKLYYDRGEFRGWKQVGGGELHQAQMRFNVGKESTKRPVTIGGKNYDIYPVIFSDPGVSNPGPNQMSVRWAIKLQNGQTLNDTYTYQRETNFLDWVKQYYNTNQGRQLIKKYRDYYKDPSLSDREVMEKINYGFRLISQYRAVFMVCDVREMSTKGRFYYDGNRKHDIASAEVFSDPLSKFHSFPYFKKDLGNKGYDYPEIKYPNQWKLEDQNDGHKAVLSDGNVKITWDYKNTIKPKTYRVFRAETQNFKAISANQIAKIESGSAAFKNREYVDVQAPMDGNDSYWYRIRAVYPGGQATPWTKSFKATASGIGEQPKEPPQEPEEPKGEKPLKPSGVDAFGLPEIIELTWKPGATSESVPGGGSSEGEGVKESEGVKSEGTKSTESQEVQGEAVTKGIGKLGSRTFDV